VRLTLARCALQSVRSDCSARKSYRFEPSSRNWLLVQSSRPTEVTPSLLERGHFAVGPAPRLCGFPSAGFAGHLSASSRALSSSFAFLQSITQSNLAGRPQPTSSSRGLLFPTAHQGSEVHRSQVLLACYVPPSGFGDPLDGLLPSIPCRPCFVPAALMGFTLRSFLLAEGVRSVTTRTNPRTVSPIGAPAAEAMGRPNRPRFLGFCPSESPWRLPGF